MDSLEGYVARASKGGASGEITIRQSLVDRLAAVLNVHCDVCRSDREFEEKASRGLRAGMYAFVVLDAWTWAGPGWVPKRPLAGHEDRTFLLDFFGAKEPSRGPKGTGGFQVPPRRILTAFPTFPGNTFLGYAVPPARLLVPAAPPAPPAPPASPREGRGGDRVRAGAAAVAAVEVEGVATFKRGCAVTADGTVGDGTVHVGAGLTVAVPATPELPPSGQGDVGGVGSGVASGVVSGSGAFAARKRAQGVVWGKDPKHYAGQEGLLLRVAGVAPLHSTLKPSDAPRALRGHPNITFHGHRTAEQWQQLLADSMFLLGLGNPLVGPSAVDALVAGCVYVDPTYPAAHPHFLKRGYPSQHPYLAAHVGPPHVCSAPLEDPGAAAACARGALAAHARGEVGPPFIPAALTEAAYDARLEAIFGPFAPEPQ